MRTHSLRLSLAGAVLLACLPGCKHTEVADNRSLETPPTQRASQQQAAAQSDPELDAVKSADACIAVAQELEKARRDQEAIALYERALSFNPSCKGITHRLACLSARTGEDEAARQRFEAAVKESPRDPQPMNDYGYFLFSRGEYKAAEKQQRRALELAPKSELFQSNLAMTLAAMLKYDESLELFERIVGPAAARSNLAVLMARNGDKDRAEKMLQDASVIDPSISQTEVVKNWLTKAANKQKANSKIMPVSFGTSNN